MLRGIGNMRELGLVLIILALCVVMSFASPYFLTWTNFRAMLMSFLGRGHRRRRHDHPADRRRHRPVRRLGRLFFHGGRRLLFLAGLDPWSAQRAGDPGVGAAIGVLMALLRHPHRAAFLHRLAGLHGDRARAVPGDHRQRRCRCSRCRRASSSSARARIYGMPFRHHHLRGGGRPLRPAAAPGDGVPKGVLHRQQREGGSSIRASGRTA